MLPERAQRVETGGDMQANEIDETNLLRASGKELLDLVERNLDVDHRDLEVASAAFLELQRRGRVKKAERICRAHGVPPIPWLKDAREALDILEPPPEGRHQGHLYVILLDGLTAQNGTYGAYVGSSRYRPETRFEQHISGVKASKRVTRRGVQLLHTLSWPWRTVPGAKTERLLWESALNRCLSLAVPKVYGDFVAVEDWPEGFQEPLRRRLSESDPA